VENSSEEDKVAVGIARRVRQYFAYTLSLPERSVRSLAALLGGATSLLTETLLPETLRGTSTYRVTVGLFQAFLIERVARVQRELGEEELALGDRYVQRKMLGNALEAAGLLTVHFSPLWVFAVAADAAGGSKVFLNRLVERLKAEGVIAQEAEPTELLEVLEALQAASMESATALDTPPLSREELARLAGEMRASYAEVFRDTGDLLPRLDELWEGMKGLAARENVSLEQLSGILTVDAAALFKKGVGTASAFGQTGAALFDKAILESYRGTLERISREGVNTYVRRHLRPFLVAARAHFDPERWTWLEGLLLGKKGGA